VAGGGLEGAERVEGGEAVFLGHLLGFLRLEAGKSG
jgi:hypothetical protein